jgi:hypothetical protein
MKSARPIILSIILISIVGCGGGGGTSPTPTATTNPPPAPVLADFPIGEDTTLVRYQDGQYIKYDIKGTVRATSSSAASTGNGTYTINYSYSSDPSFFNDGAVETQTKSHTIVIDGQANTYTQEVIQFPEDGDDTPSSSELAYREKVDGREIILGYEKEEDGSYANYGQLSLPGSPYIGYHYTDNVLKEERVNSSQAYRYDVFHELTINKLEVVQTALGTFDAYVVEVTYTETRKIDGITNSKIGKYWMHPAIGIIKAELTETSGDLDSDDEVIDFEYSIIATNVQY